MIRISGRTRVLSYALVVALAALGSAAQPAQATPAGMGGPAAVRARPSMTGAQATAALGRAEQLFHGTRRRAREIQRHEDATMVLRDLRVAYPSLTASQKKQADHLLARPEAGAGTNGDPTYAVPPSVECGADICVHYDLSTDDAVNGVDRTDGPDANTYPDYVDSVLATLEHVRATYVAAGYRAPLDDSTSPDTGGDGKTDIYLAELGDQGLYGYCFTDDPSVSDPNSTTWAASSYCVLDNDYRHAEFLAHTPLENLEVTAAHEFFHAVQFSYNFFEDHWIMEATATWAEDELYSSINDNTQYLGYSPITRPDLPIDLGSNNQQIAMHWYGTWIFFRFLTERLATARSGGLPVLMRDIWRRMDGNTDVSVSPPNYYSIYAVKAALAAHGVSLTTAMSKFALAARHPKKFFSEAAANHYPTAPLAGTIGLSPSHRGVIATIALRHLTYAAVLVHPATAMGRTWKVRLHFDLPYRSRGSAAAVWVAKRSGGSSSRLVALNSKGDATISTAFGYRAIKSVEVELVNASPRFNPNACTFDPSTTVFYTCGVPAGLDDGGRYRVTATAYKS